MRQTPSESRTVIVSDQQKEHYDSSHSKTVGYFVAIFSERSHLKLCTTYGRAPWKQEALPVRSEWREP